MSELEEGEISPSNFINNMNSNENKEINNVINLKQHYNISDLNQNDSVSNNKYNLSINTNDPSISSLLNYTSGINNNNQNSIVPLSFNNCSANNTTKSNIKNFNALFREEAKETQPKGEIKRIEFKNDNNTFPINKHDTEENFFNVEPKQNRSAVETKPILDNFLLNKKRMDQDQISFKEKGTSSHFNNNSYSHHKGNMGLNNNINTFQQGANNSYKNKESTNQNNNFSNQAYSHPMMNSEYHLNNSNKYLNLNENQKPIMKPLNNGLSSDIVNLLNLNNENKQNLMNNPQLIEQIKSLIESNNSQKPQNNYNNYKNNKQKYNNNNDKAHNSSNHTNHANHHTNNPERMNQNILYNKQNQHYSNNNSNYNNNKFNSNLTNNKYQNSNNYNNQQANSHNPKSRINAIGKIPCNYFKNGCCNKGDNCTFSHNFEPEKKSNELCKFFVAGNCFKGKNCIYSHNLKAFPCKYYHALGYCDKGVTCMFSHVPIININDIHNFIETNFDFFNELMVKIGQTNMDDFYYDYLSKKKLNYQEVINNYKNKSNNTQAHGTSTTPNNNSYSNNNNKADANPQTLPSYSSFSMIPSEFFENNSNQVEKNTVSEEKESKVNDYSGISYNNMKTNLTEKSIPPSIDPFLAISNLASLIQKSNTSDIESAQLLNKLNEAKDPRLRKGKAKVSL